MSHVPPLQHLKLEINNMTHRLTRMATGVLSYSRR